ncbi:hypothetical protein K227x_29330 [Rubripirellula lacrimiformis]|uniref:Translational regulator CsrA n=1 Tax=Rubripirellula lacrimiformis TaxID=1930273 RepID=A0A517NBP3_9BACT|nr:carbon storage regulator [Rubripirellula lacrimiformis]QDT04541.1 hypothetical protein K227x_29330 [Rubripirellula lacrimiformis]
MLVLTRKIDETILIGDDIKITLIRVKGNSVRIGIEAPRSIRVVRGELDLEDATKKVIVKQEVELEMDGDIEIDDLAEVFAHPETQEVGRPSRKMPANRLKAIEATTAPEVYVGTVRRSGDEAKLNRAPLAGFVSAS